MASESSDDLPTNVAPFHYDMAIKTDIDQGRFDGKAVIHLNVQEDSEIIQLHAYRDLELLSILVTRPQGSPIAFRFSNNDRNQEEDGLPYAQLQNDDRLILRFGCEQRLLAGEIGVQLHLSWSGSLHNGDGIGYVTRACRDIEGNFGKLALTNLQSSQARMVYPCWDEPSRKATFSISMVSKNGLACLSCMSETLWPRGMQVSLAEDLMDHGWGAVHFETTLPISTSLFVWATGPVSCLKRAYVSDFTGKIVRVTSLIPENGLQRKGPPVANQSMLACRKTYYLNLDPAGKADLSALPPFPDDLFVKKQILSSTVDSSAGSPCFDHESDTIGGSNFRFLPVLNATYSC